MLKLPDSLPLSLAAVLVAAVTGCANAASGPDMEPIGSGLKFIGIGLVVMALVFVLGSQSD